MATDLLTRKSSTPSEAYLERHFAELCARVKRVDLVTHLLALVLAITGYALVVGGLDWFVGASNATSMLTLRWLSFVGFLVLFGILLVRAARCLFRRVNPYYVARRLEETLPEAKNSLINWLDLHGQDLPSAFQTHLSARAADHFREIDAEQTLPKRKNRILLGLLALPTLGLLLLLLLDPSAFLARMLHAFAPFYTPPDIARTHITLLQPTPADAEVGATQAVPFAARITGRIPAGTHAEAPRLLFRYQTNEDYFTQPLQSDGDGAWTTQLLASQLHTGFSYRIAAGDAETPEHQVRVRARAHVKQFEITYHYRAYRQLAKKTVVFPDKEQSVPAIAGVRGTEVEMIVKASRPVKSASVQIVSGKRKQDLPIRMSADDPHTFACRWTLEQSGHFRIAFTSTDGEENTDRQDFPITVRDDEAPTVVLTNPGKDVSFPENGTLELEGLARDDGGIKGLSLHVRILTGANKPKLVPKVYRPETNFRSERGTYPDEIAYLDFLALDQLKDDKGTIHLLPAGTVLEYWLEATDNADYPQPKGNIGKSLAYKITLTPALKDASQQAAQRDKAVQKQKTHAKNQDEQLAKKQPKQGPNSSKENAQQEQQKQKDELDNTKKKIDDALNKEKKKPEKGASKSANPQNADKKEGPGNSAGEPKPQPTSPKEAGDKKDQGSGNAGESKDGRSQEKKQPSESKGESKAGPKDPQGGAKDGGPKPKEGPAGQAKDRGPMGMNTPAPSQPKEQPSDAPKPQVKHEPKTDPLAKGKGDAKGFEKNGPETPDKDTAMNPMQPPNPKAKGGKNDPNMNDAEPKQTPPEQAKEAGKPRGDNPDKAKTEPTWDHLAKLTEHLAKNDKAANESAAELAEIGKKSDDVRKAELAKEALAANDRDPGTGLEKKKAPNPFGSGGQTTGISDEVKAAAANREFARRIAQMQLDDWKKSVTADTLKRAGMSDADWQRFVKGMQAYDTLVRQRNAELARKQVKDLRGGPGMQGNVGVRPVEGAATSRDQLDPGFVPAPPELRDAQDRFTQKR